MVRRRAEAASGAGGQIHINERGGRNREKQAARTQFSAGCGGKTRPEREILGTQGSAKGNVVGNRRASWADGEVNCR